MILPLETKTMRSKGKNKTVTASFRLPANLHKNVMDIVKKSGMDFSEFVRHAVQREMEKSHFSDTYRKNHNPATKTKRNMG